LDSMWELWSTHLAPASTNLTGTSHSRQNGMSRDA
jgi:hypothetical protein